MEITKREIIASISIIALMLIFGVIICGKISEKIMDSNEKYNKAIKIEDEELFKYGMSTSIGNAFVYGELKIIDPVTYTDSKGKTKTKTETYWTWDVVKRESIKSQKVTFLGVEFDYSRFSRLSDSYITTIKESSDIRYKYYGSPIRATGTIFTTLQDNNIDNDIKLYENMDITKTYDYLQEGFGLLFLFWFTWIVIIIGLVYGFYYLDNNWLNY